MDKGTFDALCPVATNSKVSCGDAENGVGKAMLHEISRIVGSRGRFICISLLQPHVASRLLLHFHSLGWMIRIHRCLDAEAKTEERNTENTLVFPVFMVVFTKMCLPSGFTPVSLNNFNYVAIKKLGVKICMHFFNFQILEASNLSNNKFTRFKTLEELLEHIKEQQNFAVVKRGLKNLRTFGDKELTMKLASSSTGEDRYALFILDIAGFLKNPVQKRFGIFIVPQGR